MDELYSALTGQAAAPRPYAAATAGAAAGAAPAPTEPSAPAPSGTPVTLRDILPAATPGDLAGFIDVAGDYRDGIDLADLADLLSYEVDDLFPLVDAAKKLGMITTARGHVTLTTMGERWAAADMQGRKGLFAKMTRSKIPLVRSIDRALKTNGGRPLDADLVLDLLEGDRSADDARREFDTAVSWGRYAELFDFDAATNTLTLDPANVA